MIHRIIKIILTAVFLLLFVAPLTNRVAGQPALVGVSIPADADVDRQRISERAQVVIDYGSFTWAVLTLADLADLDLPAAAYQETPSTLAGTDPYALTLGGQTFDPLLSQPIFDVDGEGLVDASIPALHLVQFHGPTKAEWLKGLEAGGLEIVQYIHPFTYVVWGESASLASQASRDFVRWTGDYLPAYALQAQNRVSQGETSHVRILVYPKAGLTQTIQAVESLGGSVLGASAGQDPTFDVIAYHLPGDQIQAVAALPGVYTVQPMPTDGGSRGEMSNQVNAGNLDWSNRAFPGYLSWLDQLSLSGQGVIIANVDTGVDGDHPDLVSRMLPCSGATCAGTAASSHGTHTAGIMAGDGSSGVLDGYGFLRGLGMAPGANLVEQLYSPTYTNDGGMLTLMTESQRNGAVISGNSWGPAGTALGYDADTRWVDIGVRDADPDAPGNQPLTYVLSIMNGYGGVSSQGTPDEAKNILTVGSTIMQYGDGSQNLNINNLSVNTAHGPALDGRTIPHLVAPGCYVDSANYPGSGHILRCGTSMASPHVSGAAALFFEKVRNQFGVDPSPALVKAAFLPVAHDLAGYRDADGGIMGHPFDAKQGWGRLNISTVLKPPGEVIYMDQDVIFDETGQSWSIDLTTHSESTTLKAMLVWTDAPGHGLGGSTPAWVNDLDLSMMINDQTYYGNNFGGDGLSIAGGTPDDRNNTEGIFLRALPQGTYTLTVTAAQISGDGVPDFGDSTDQDFALVIYFDEQEEEPRFEYRLPLFLYNFSHEEYPYSYIFPLFFR